MKMYEYTASSAPATSIDQRLDAAVGSYPKEIPVRLTSPTEYSASGPPTPPGSSTWKTGRSERVRGGGGGGGAAGCAFSSRSSSNGSAFTGMATINERDGWRSEPDEMKLWAVRVPPSILKTNGAAPATAGPAAAAVGTATGLTANAATGAGLAGTFAATPEERTRSWLE